MAHVFCYWPRPFFYAFGNTPAVCLTDHLAPEEDADVLLLGCGDARSLLYTMFVDDAHGRRGKAKLDVTCCDLEPGVLARNILLFSLLADDPDGKNIELVWNFYYDMFLTNEAHKLVTRQSRKLADLSTTMDDWGQGAYGKWLRMCTTGTLNTLHALWKCYADTDNVPNNRKKAFAAKYLRKKMELEAAHKIRSDSSAGAVRSTGHFGIEENFQRIVDQCYQQYWKSGVVGSSAKSPTLPNPTFAYTGKGEDFCLHYGSNPILGYHLLPLLVQCKDAPKNPRKIAVSTLVIYAKKQFSVWCHNFSKAVMKENQKTEAPKLVLRFFAGDLFPLCTALRQCSKGGSVNTGLYPHAWTAKEMILYDADYGSKPANQNEPIASITEKAPTSFNIINTSNLVDHVGLLNLLLATTPLLREGISSSLMTEALKNNEESGTQGLESLLHGNLLLMGTLLEVLPATYFSGYSTRSTIENGLTRALSDRDNGGSFDRTYWKPFHIGFTSFETSTVKCRQIAFDAKQLSRFLLNVYVRMFDHENTTNKFKSMSAGLSAFNKFILFHNTRESFAKFLLAVKDCVETDWSDAMSRLIDLIIADRNLLMGMNNFQDFNGQLRLNNIFEMDEPSAYPPPPKQMLSWKDIPKMVCISLVVPRKSLATLLSGDIAMGSPVVQAEIMSGAGHNHFHSLHMVFGKIIASAAEDKTTGNSYSIVEDEKGCHGTSDLIVVFQAPSCNIRLSPHDCTIGFQVHATPSSTVYFMSKLGWDLCFFRAKLSDTTSVYISRRPPNISKACSAPSRTIPNFSIPQEPFYSQTSIQLDSNCERASSITVRITKFSDTAARELAEGAQVSVDVTSISTLLLKFGSFSHQIEFSLPIKEDAVRTRIARKSSYIELIAAIRNGNPDTFDLGPQKRFPILKSDQRMVLWNMHRVSLDNLSSLDLTINHQLWLVKHLGSTITSREYKVLKEESKNKEFSDTITGVKHIINEMFMSFLRAQEGRDQPIVLLAADGGEPFARNLALVIPTDIRLDSASQTVVLDACVLPFVVYPERIPQFECLYRKCGVYLLGSKEQRAWRELLASAVERARGTSYTHDKSKCEYLQSNTVPLSYEAGKAFLCSCSQGHASKAFLNNPEYRPYSKMVHRAAFGPLFGVACKEDGLMEELLSRDRAGENVFSDGGTGGTEEPRRPPQTIDMDMLLELMKRELGV